MLTLGGSDDDSRGWVPAMHVGDLSWVPGSQLLVSSVSFDGVWEVNQQVRSQFHSDSVCVYLWHSKIYKRKLTESRHPMVLTSIHVPCYTSPLVTSKLDCDSWEHKQASKRSWWTPCMAYYPLCSLMKGEWRKWYWALPKGSEKQLNRWAPGWVRGRALNTGCLTSPDSSQGPWEGRASLWTA